MIRLLTIFVCIFLLASHLSALSIFDFDPYSKEATNVRHEINKNNVDFIKGYIQKRGGKLSKKEQILYLTEMFTDNNQNSRLSKDRCKSEIVDLLVNSNKSKSGSIRFSSPLSWGHQIYPKQILRVATDRNCPDTVKNLFSITKDEDVISLINGPKMRIGDKVYENFNAVVLKEAKTRGTLNRIEAVIYEYAQFFVKNKKSGKQTEDIRVTASDFHDAGMKALKIVDAKNAAIAYRQSPEGIRAQAIEIVEKINKQKALIEKQKKIASISGMVDKKILYDAGERIVKYEEQLQKVKNKYLRLTGTSLVLPN